MPYKIAILGPAHPFRGGIAQGNHRLAQELVRQGHQVEIYTFTLQYPSWLFPGKTQYSPDSAPENLRIRRVLSSLNPISWFKTARAILSYAPQILLIRYWHPIMIPCFSVICLLVRRAKLADLRIIMLADNLISHERHLGERLLCRLLLRLPHAFMVMSEQVSHDLQSLGYTGKIAYCPHPLFDHFGAKVSRTQALRKLRLRSDKRYLLFFGLIREYKGLDLLLKAMSDRRIRQLGLELIVAGEFYRNPQAYYQQVHALALGERVHFYSYFIPDHEVSSYFCAADLLVQPYKNATQSGISQIAYHFDLPMVLTKVGGLAETISHGVNGYSVACDSEAIADAIVDFYTQHREQTMRAAIEAQKSQYSWAKMVKTLEATYADLMG